MPAQASYQSDLACIHDAGFGQLAEGAAGVVAEALRRSGARSGLVVDLGCGSGITARLLCDAGYRVMGIDLSAASIEIARKRAPEAEFRIGSFATADIPPCVAATAIGEVFNYAFDEANSDSVREAVVSRIYAALCPGGVLVFDVAGPARAPSAGPQRSFAEGDGWAVLVEAEGDESRTVLTRRITTFRKQGELYRRSDEIHRLQLVDPVEVVRMLDRAGFAVTTLDRYCARRLPQGLVGFLARKPAL